jgi:signal transduction histidine kinase
VALGITQLRHLITELRPAALDELGVKPALEALAERVSVVNDLAVVLHVDLGDDRGQAASRLAPSLETTIYRLVQEALTNAVKHARASRVEVTVVEAGDGVEITVADDGAGFDPDAVGEGFGLLGMRERVTLIDGSLTIESAVGAGTRIRCRLPLQRAEPAVRLRSLAG